MANTSLGDFDGKSWESLCQLVFKKKYGSEGYQQIHASPGDYGLEGFTVDTGKAFQCYCPDKPKTTKELYEAQRGKITSDLGKLRLYEADIAKRIQGTLIGTWIFVTPAIAKNELLAHARSKEEEVRGWGLSILRPEFKVLLHDSGHYLLEINEIKAASGAPLIFDSSPAILSPLTASSDEYEQNVLRKSQLRLAHKSTVPSYTTLVERMHARTLESFLQADAYLRRIEESAPTHYMRLVGLINEYSNNVEELSISWGGSAEALTEQVRSGLEQRIVSELSPVIDSATASKIARLITARWTAICQLDYV